MLFGYCPEGNKFANTGVGENNVDSPLHLRDGLVETIKVVQFGNVSLNARNVAADCLYGLVEFLLATARDKDICPLLAEWLCRSQPNPFGAACDKSDLIFKLVGHLFLRRTAQCADQPALGNWGRATSEYSRRYPRRMFCKDPAFRMRHAASPVRCPAFETGDSEAAAQCRIRRSPRPRFAWPSTR